jgi:hypothetical protein
MTSSPADGFLVVPFCTTPRMLSADAASEQTDITIRAKMTRFNFS